MKLSDILLWLTPIINIVAGFFLSHVKKMRKFRYVLYAIVVFVAFLLDLTSVSFTYYMLDIMLLLVVTLIFSEIFWNAFRSKNKFFFTACVIIGLASFFITYKKWIFAGPAYIRAFRESPVVSRYKGIKNMYVIKETGMIQKTQDRAFILYKNFNNLPLEKLVAKFRAPQGYSRAEFRFRWFMRNEGISVDLIGDEDTLWTLEEEIRE